MVNRGDRSPSQPVKMVGWINSKNCPFILQRKEGLVLGQNIPLFLQRVNNRLPQPVQGESELAIMFYC